MTYRKKPNLDLLPKDEQRALLAVARAQTPQEIRAALLELAALRCAKVRKSARDKAADSRKRVLVGARIPREEAWLIARAADMKGVSLYCFCRNSLLDQVQEILTHGDRTLVCLQVERGAWCPVLAPRALRASRAKTTCLWQCPACCARIPSPLPEHRWVSPVKPGCAPHGLTLDLLLFS